MDGQLHIRWMIQRDMPEVEAIENASFQFPWSHEDFIRCLRQRNCIGMVVDYDAKVVGFMIYELHRNRLHILSFAVHPDCRYQGVGTAMVNKLVGKLATQRRNRILLEIRESNLDAQLFFHTLGFRAISILKDFYDERCDEDAYLFEYVYAPAEVKAST